MAESAMRLVVWLNFFVSITFLLRLTGGFGFFSKRGDQGHDGKIGARSGGQTLVSLAKKFEPQRPAPLEKFEIAAIRAIGCGLQNSRLLNRPKEKMTKAWQRHQLGHVGFEAHHSLSRPKPMGLGARITGD